MNKVLYDIILRAPGVAEIRYLSKDIPKERILIQLLIESYLKKEFSLKYLRKYYSPSSWKFLRATYKSPSSGVFLIILGDGSSYKFATFEIIPREIIKEKSPERFLTFSNLFIRFFAKGLLEKN